MSMIKTLGTFECTALLGKGGMGEVYLAKDQKLGRDVAIKVLPEEFARDTDRIARFQREAKLLASLNHPNIASIYGLEESNGTHFLVLELIEGDTVADRIKNGAIPVEESLKLALQIAEALETAHEKGVIHRDLKPANLKVTPEGKVKVLDFGLAKAFAGNSEDTNLSNSPTLSVAATQQGVILGTAAYMSPEQARGETVDRRADIWAFGCVLFEMLTGRTAFEGHSVSDVLASVLKIEPEWKSLPPNLHPRIRLLLERCLEKKSKNRYGVISDARVDIENALAEPGGVFMQPIPAAGAGMKFRQMLPWIAAAVILSVIITGAAVWRMMPSKPRQVMRFDFELPEGQQFAHFGNPMLGVSPDGSKFAYCTREGIYLRLMDELNSRLISGSGGYPVCPFFSPDGQWIGYWSVSDSKLKKIAVGGGISVTLCDAASPGRPTWSTDDTIVYVQDEGIMAISASGGTPQLIVESKGDEFAVPQLLPGGKSMLFTVVDGAGTQIAVQSLESGERKELLPGANATYLSTGYIVYRVGNNLLAVAFDLDTLEVEGSPVSMVEGIKWLGDVSAAQFAISDSGTLVYIPGLNEQTGRRVLARVDRNGRIHPLKAPAKAYVGPRVSPDGKKIAVQSIEADSGGTIWIYDLSEDSAIRQLTFEGSNYRPIWTPDSERITFSSDLDGTMSLYWMPADGNGVAERLTTAEDDTNHWSCSWSPDGKTLAFMIERDPYSNWEIWLVSPGGEAESLYARQGTLYLGAQFSPDGHWIAYSHSITSMDLDVFVEPFPPTGALHRITQGGGRGNWPIWSHDGKELFYRPSTVSGQPIALKAVDIVTNPGFAVRNERTLPIKGFSSVSFYRGYDIVKPDGEEFIMTFPADSAGMPESEDRKIIVVTNWFEELKERVAVE